MPLVNLVYSSTASKLFSGEDLQALLHRAREKNARLGITGLLLYRQGVFMQALEGEEPAVRALYAVIRADSRHRNVMTLADLPVGQPRFSDWSMGFENLDELGSATSGPAAGSSLPPKVEFPWRGSIAMQFLTAFWGANEIPPTLR